MGTWDAGSFGNDAALDFLGALDDPATIAATIRAEAGASDPEDAAVVIAACDLVAAALGRPAGDMPGDMLASLAPLPAPDAALLSDARAAIGRIRARSELAELWAEDDDGAWQAALDDLLARLDPDRDYVPPPADDAPQGAVFVHCALCEASAPEDEAVDLVHEVDDGIIQYSMTLHAHRTCLEQHCPPPAWNADGTPHSDAVRQVFRSVGGTDF